MIIIHHRTLFQGQHFSDCGNGFSFADDWEKITCKACLKKKEQGGKDDEKRSR